MRKIVNIKRCAQVCTPEHVHVHTHTEAHTQEYTCTYACTYTDIQTHAVYMHMQAHAHTCRYTHARVCTLTDVHAHACTCIHRHTQKERNAGLVHNIDPRDLTCLL